ncbi:MAG: hypothetical protein AAF297_03705 [Planctomycetota bacterium]
MFRRSLRATSARLGTLRHAAGRPSRYNATKHAADFSIDTLEPRQLLSDDPIQIQHAAPNPHGSLPPVVLAESAGGYTGLSGRIDSTVEASSRADGSISLAFDNLAGRPTVLESTDNGATWQGTDILSRIGLDNAQTEVVSWTDPASGQTFGAVVSNFNLYIFSQDANGNWSATNLNEEANVPADQTPLASLTAFIGPDDRARIVGINRNGETVLYQQTLGLDVRNPDPQTWFFINLTGNLESRGLTAPEFVSDLTTYVTTWGQTTIAGLDSSGDIQTIWTVPSIQNWNTTNLSSITNAPRFVGAITPFLTTWGGINIAGMTSEGSLEAVWWVPQFGGDWRTVDLTESFNGPALDPASVTSFVTPWGGLNVAGVRADSEPGQGELVAYWWAPGLELWNVASLASAFGFTDRFASSVEATVTPQGQFNLLGPDADGDIIRYSWLPGDTWRSQNLSAVATPAHASEVVSLESDIDRVLVGADNEIFFSAYVPFATSNERVFFYDDQGETDAVFELFDNGDAALGDLVAGDGLYAACYVWTPGQSITRVFEASLEGALARASDDVTSIDRPTEDRLEQITAQNVDFQRKLSQSSGGVLDLAAAALDIAEAPGINNASVRVNEEGISWETDEGIVGVALVNEANYDGQRAGGPDAGAGGGSVNIPPNSTGNEALVLGPYFYQFETGGGDETDDIAQILNNAGIGTTANWNTDPDTDRVTLDDFKSLGGYDIVSIVSHGAAFPEYGVVVDTGVDITPQAVEDNLADLISGRLAWSGSEESGTFAITPDFVRRYAGDMSGAVIYMGACKSAFDRSMADAFIAAGAEAYIGYTDIVQSSFANERGIRAFQHLAGGGAAGDIQGINIDTEAAPDADPATFALFGQPDAPLPSLADNNPDVPFDIDEDQAFFFFAAEATTASTTDTALTSIQPGALIALAFTFDDLATDQNPSENSGLYGGIQNVFLTIGDQTFAGPSDGFSVHAVERPTGEFNVTDYAAELDFTASLPTGEIYDIAVDVLLSASGDLFTSDQLPETFDLTDFENGLRRIDIGFSPAGEDTGVGFVSGDINTFIGPLGSSTLNEPTTPTDPADPTGPTGPGGLEAFTFAGFLTSDEPGLADFASVRTGDEFAFSFIFDPAADDELPSDNSGRYAGLSLASVSLGDNVDLAGEALPASRHEVYLPGPGNDVSEYDVRFDFSTTLPNLGPVDILIDIDLEAPGAVFTSDALPLAGIDLNNFADHVRAFQLFVRPQGQDDAVGVFQGDVLAFAGSNGVSILNGFDGGGFGSDSFDSAIFSGSATDSVNGSFIPGYFDDSAFSLAFTYADDASDTNGSDSVGQYPLDITNVSLTLGSNSLFGPAASSGTVQVIIPDTDSQPEAYNVFIEFESFLEGFGAISVSVRMELLSSSDVFPDDQLPSFIDASAFDVLRAFEVTINTPDGGDEPLAEYFGNVDSIFIVT